MFTRGVSAGTKTWAPMPAAAAYAASAPPAFPAEGRQPSLPPSSFARETATESPRALNDPVGLQPSSFIYKSSAPIFPAVTGARSSGVPPSPRLTIAEGSPTGRSSRYRHIVPSRPPRPDRRKDFLASSRSYTARSAAPHAVQTPWSRSPVCDFLQTEQLRCEKNVRCISLVRGMFGIPGWRGGRAASGTGHAASIYLPREEETTPHGTAQRIPVLPKIDSSSSVGWFERWRISGNHSITGKSPTPPRYLLPRRFFFHLSGGATN